MKRHMIFAAIGSLAVLASNPASADFAAKDSSSQRVSAEVVLAQTTDWAKYCRTIRNRPHRQQCQQMHGVPYSK